MKIEPTGIVMAGECEIQGPHCSAKNKVSAITAVWEHPVRRQINVCRACLDEMIRNGEWEIVGATIEQHADIEVADKDGNTIAVVEVKRVPPMSVDREKWAVRIRRNLLAHAAIPRTPYFILAAWPGPFYLWSGKQNELEAPPDYHFKVDRTIKNLVPAEDDSDSERSLIEATAKWIVSLAKSAPHDQPLPIRRSGLASRLPKARVRVNPSPYGGKPATP